MSVETAVFGGGCFWCTEAVIQQLRGVVTVTSGYAGGHTPNPAYEQVSSGNTGHAEVVKIDFDPSVITYRDLLTIFFASHDPTQLNAQGADVGSQYRSIILTTSDTQQSAAQEFIQEINISDMEGEEVVTEIKPLEAFYEAEAGHQNFYNSNPNYGYSLAIISPKLKKVREKFKVLLKDKL